MMEYRYLAVDSKKADSTISHYAQRGWRVHTLHRDGKIVKILFETKRTSTDDE